MAYTAPTPANLVAKYPKLAQVPSATIQIWLTEAATECAGWPEDIRARAEMLYAAHHLMVSGAIKTVTGSGVTSFKSGDFSVTVGDQAAARTGYSATEYGRQFSALMYRCFGGPRIVTDCV